MKKIITMTAFLQLFSCTRLPDKLYNPTAVIRAEMQDTKTVYTMYIKGTMLNEHDEKIFKNIKGIISISNNDKNLINIPFEIEQLLPFQKIELNAEKTVSEYEINPILNLLRISPEQLRVINEPVYTEEIPIYHKLIQLHITNYEVLSIFDILRGTQNENK